MTLTDCRHVFRLCRMLDLLHLREYRAALLLDRAQATNRRTIRFCDERVAIIDRVLRKRMVVVRAATDEEQRTAIVTAAKQMMADGATHDCSEWFRNGVCELCGREDQP